MWLRRYAAVPVAAMVGFCIATGCTGELFPVTEPAGHGSDPVVGSEDETPSDRDTGDPSPGDTDSDGPTSPDTATEATPVDSDTEMDTEEIGCRCRPPERCEQEAGWSVNSRELCYNPNDQCCYLDCEGIGGTCVPTNSADCYDMEGLLFDKYYVRCPVQGEICCVPKDLGCPKCPTGCWDLSYPADCMGPDDAAALRHCVDDWGGAAARGCGRETEVCCMFPLES